MGCLQRVNEKSEKSQAISNPISFKGLQEIGLKCELIGFDILC